MMSLNFIFASFVIVQQAVLTKEMNFKSLMIRDLAAVVTSGVVGIWLALKGYGVWSLVYQLLVFTMMNGILLWVLSAWKPKLIFSFPAIKEIFHYSAHMTGFSILNYVARNIDYLLIGKFLGAELLGYYTLAYKLMLYPLQNISWTVGRVMFPAFSKIQSDLEKVRFNYMKMVKVISLITFPMMLGLFIVAPEFINVVYGPKWYVTAGLIRVLCFCGLLQSVSTTSGNIYMSQGKVKLQFKITFFSTIFAAAAIALGLRWGLTGVVSLYLFYTVIMFHVTLFTVARIIELKFKLLYSVVAEVFIKSILVFLVLLSIKRIFQIHSLPLLILLIVPGILFNLFLIKDILKDDGFIPARFV